MVQGGGQRRHGHPRGLPAHEEAGEEAGQERRPEMSARRAFRKPRMLEPDQAIETFATIHPPESAEAPILMSGVRAAMRQWLVEMGAADDLKAVGLEPRRTALLSGPPGCGKTTLA